MATNIIQIPATPEVGVQFPGLQGPAGPQGAQGIQGPAGSGIVDSGTSGHLIETGQQIISLSGIHNTLSGNLNSSGGFIEQVSGNLLNTGQKINDISGRLNTTGLAIQDFSGQFLLTGTRIQDISGQLKQNQTFEFNSVELPINLDTIFIPFTGGSFGGTPKIVGNMLNESGNTTFILHSLSGVTTSGFNILLSDTLDLPMRFNYFATTGSGQYII